MYQKYNALAYSDIWSDGRSSGMLSVQNQEIVFTSTDGTALSMPIQGLIIDSGGTSNRQVFFRNPQVNHRFSTADIKILEEHGFQNHPHLKSKALGIKKQKNIFKFSLIAVSAILLIGLVSLFYFKDNIVKGLAKSVPYSAQQSLGKSYIQQLSLLGTLDSSSAAHHILRKKIDLLTVHEKSDYDFKVFISDDEQVNAFALPGGYMVFNKGLLMKAESWEEVLGVAAHEIAHVTQNHHTRGIFSRIGMFTVLSMVFGDGGMLTDIVFGAGAQLEGLSYSRDFETESDEKGFEYLTKANIDPKGLRIFFDKLDDSKEGEIASKIPEFISTHPSNQNRIDNIKRLEKSIVSKKIIDLGNYLEFRDQLIIADSKNKIETEDKLESEKALDK